MAARLGSYAAQHQRFLRKLPNGHLHLALGAALLFCSLIALAVPIARTHASSANDNPQAGVLVVSDSLTSASGGSAGQAALAAIPIRTSAVAFTLHENGLVTSHVTTQATVADALADAGVTLNKADVVVPPADTRLTPGMHVYVTYARRIRVRTARDETDVFTQASIVGDALKDAGFDLEPQDIITPARTKAVSNGMVVSLSTIRSVQESEDSPIPFDTVYQYDAGQAHGTTKVTQAGANGYVHHEYSVKQINGQEVARQETAETIVQPTPQVVTIGTYVPDTPAPEPVTPAPDGSGQCLQTVSVWATYYTAASAGGSTTATGTGVYKGIIAVDPRYIPLGTRMYVPGYGYGIAADTGGGVKGYFIDLAYGAGDSYDWYSHYVDVCILG
jgi:3D (Asp-Asp-Asp) domain-containing protein